MSVPVDLPNRENDDDLDDVNLLDTFNNWDQAAGSSDKEDVDLEEESSPGRNWREKRSGSRDSSGAHLKMQKIQPSSSEHVPLNSMRFRIPDSIHSENDSVADALKANNNHLPSMEQDQNEVQMDDDTNASSSPSSSSRFLPKFGQVPSAGDLAKTALNFQAPILISVDEHNKLKMEANQHKQLKLKHRDLEEQHINLLKQNKSLQHQLKSKKQVTQTEHEQLKQKQQKHDTFVEKLKSKVECPVCYEMPKRTPIPVCPNGHIVCQKCRQDACPMCREPMEGANSLLAVTVVENFLHNCDHTMYGCKVKKVEHSDIVKHLDACPYRFHGNAWKKLSEVSGIKLKGGCVDLGVKFSPVTSFYDFEEMDSSRRKVMWPPNAVEFDGSVFFLYVVADADCGIWRFIVSWGECESNPCRDGSNHLDGYTASIEVFKPGDSSGCRRHFHMHRSTGRFDKHQQHVLTLDNSQMQGLFLEKKFAVSVEIGFLRDLVGEMGFCCDVNKKARLHIPFHNYFLANQ